MDNDGPFLTHIWKSNDTNQGIHTAYWLSTAYNMTTEAISEQNAVSVQ